MRRNRIVHVFAAAALALGLAAAARAAGSAPGGTHVIGLDQEPPTLDPHASPSAATFQIILNVTESLVHQGVDGKIVPWLAAGYTVSPDGKSFVFNLRKDVTFSDGSPLNAAAVKWNLDRIVDPNFKAGGALLALTRYAGSAVVDDSTVRVEFKTPYAPFLAYAAAGTLAMLSPKATAAQGAAVGRQPVGSGPFVVSEWAARDHITLARNPLYARRAPWSNHQGPPYLDRVVWRIIPETGTRAVTIQSGETQMITLLGAPGSVLAGLRSDPALRIESVPYPGSSRLLALNAKRPPTDDLRVRRAINYGVNRAAYFDSIYKGLGTPACAPIDQVLLRDPDACAA